MARDKISALRRTNTPNLAPAIDLMKSGGGGCLFPSKGMGTDVQKGARSGTQRSGGLLEPIFFYSCSFFCVRCHHRSSSSLPPGVGHPVPGRDRGQRPVLPTRPRCRGTSFILRPSRCQLVRNPPLRPTRCFFLTLYPPHPLPGVEGRGGACFGTMRWGFPLFATNPPICSSPQPHGYQYFLWPRWGSDKGGRYFSPETDPRHPRCSSLSLQKNLVRVRVGCEKKARHSNFRVRPPISDSEQARGVFRQSD